MKVIPVKMRNRNASLKCMVDDEDYEIVKNFHWVLQGREGNFYIETKKGRYGGKNSWRSALHRTVMWRPDGMVIDHIDGNFLNNQKSNLRVCTPNENRCNKKLDKRNRAGFTGVYWRERGKKWEARVTHGGVRYKLGYFVEKEDAINAYDAKARELFGEFYRKNKTQGYA